MSGVADVPGVASLPSALLSRFGIDSTSPRPSAIARTPRVKWRRNALLLLIALAWLCTPPLAAAADEIPELTVYRRATCTCCRPWIKYMEANGFTINVVDVDNMAEFKAKRLIPTDLAACHTTEVAGYTLEGHVSADDVRRLLRDRPPIRGLFVPGMPVGAPGMEGPNPVAYDVIAVDSDGKQSVYVRHEPGATLPTSPE
jgi:hypothetical protein